MTFRIRLIPDDYHLTEVGVLESGALCWTTSQLDTTGNQTRDFIVTYVFDEAGRLIWHLIDDLGQRGESQRNAKDVVADHRAKVGQLERKEIQIYPFSVEAHGLVFGLMVRKPDEEEEISEGGPYVDAMPGWTLMFYPPWETCNYDT